MNRDLWDFKNTESVDFFTLSRGFQCSTNFSLKFKKNYFKNVGVCGSIITAPWVHTRTKSKNFAGFGVGKMSEFFMFYFTTLCALSAFSTS